jgi:hypothetical protein
VSETSGTFYYTTRALTVKEWAVNHWSIVNIWNRIFFLSSSNKICQIAKWQNIDWFEVLELSERPYVWISNIMSTLSKTQNTAFGYFLPKENNIKWFDKSEWATFNDTCIVYDVWKDKFLVDTQKYFYDWTFLNWYNYTASHINWSIYKDEYSQDDEWQAIPFTYHTKQFFLSDPTIKKIFWETRTLLDINDMS